MKKLVVAVFTLLLAMPVILAGSNTPSGATKKETKGGKSAGTVASASMVNTLSEESFRADIGNISDVAWTHTSDMDVATYTRNNEKDEAIFDFNGNLIGTSKAVKFSALPKSAQDRIKKEYRDYTIGQVIHFDYTGEIAPDFVMSGNQFDSPQAYFVDLKKGTRTLVVEVNPGGDVILFSEY
jgi:hypothetical protein